MTHYDPDGKAGSTYEIIQINGVDSESNPSAAVVAK